MVHNFKTKTCKSRKELWTERLSVEPDNFKIQLSTFSFIDASRIQSVSGSANKLKTYLNIYISVL